MQKFIDFHINGHETRSVQKLETKLFEAPDTIKGIDLFFSSPKQQFQLARS